MNERIKQLAEQAGITTNLDTDFYEKDMNRWVDYFSEKFAELIVKECIDTVSDCSIEYCTRPQIVSEIREHFGVES